MSNQTWAPTTLVGILTVLALSVDDVQADVQQATDDGGFTCRNWDQTSTISGGPLLLPFGRIRGYRFETSRREDYSLFDLALLETNLRIWPLGNSPSDTWSLLGLEVGGGHIGGLTGGNLAAESGGFAHVDALFRLGPDCGAKYQLSVGGEWTGYLTRKGRPDHFSEYHMTAHWAPFPSTRLSFGARRVTTRFAIASNAESVDQVVASELEAILLGGALDLRFPDHEDHGVHFKFSVYGSNDVDHDDIDAVIRWQALIGFRQALADHSTGLLRGVLRADEDRSWTDPIRITVSPGMRTYSGQGNKGGGVLDFVEAPVRLEVIYWVMDVLALSAEVGANIGNQIGMSAVPSLYLRRMNREGENKLFSNWWIRIGSIFVPVSTVLKEPDNPDGERHILIRGDNEATETFVHLWGRVLVSLELGVLFHVVNLDVRRWNPTGAKEWQPAGRATSYLLGPGLKWIFAHWGQQTSFLAEASYQSGVANFNGGPMARRMTAGIAVRYDFGEVDYE